jgi:ankyrin repeat protein
MEDLETLKGLNRAVIANELENVGHILDENPTLNLNITGLELKETALHFAARMGLVDVAKLLLERGASPESKTAYTLEQNPLHRAIESGASLDLVKLLVESFPEPEDQVRYVNLPNKRGQSPLHYASTSRHERMPDVMKYLICAGADLNFQDDRGFSAAHQIVALGIPATLKILLDLDPTACSRTPGIRSKGKTSLHLAATYGTYGRGPSTEDNLEWLLDNSNMEMAKKRDASKTTAWEMLWDRSEIHKASLIGAFVLKDKDNGTFNRLFSWQERSMSWRISESYYTFNCNNVSLPLPISIPNI